jgi:ABC-type transport system involved in Fe-S cluster assembly fused permease/ATPase subunit
VVRFEDVNFAYDPARPILHDVSFEIPAGKTVAVVGRLGRRQEHAGAAAVPLLRRDRRRITIDGQDIRAVTQASLRQAIGIVPQDTVLFNDTVEYNIAYGRPGATRGRGGGRGPGGAHPRLHRQPRPRATTRWWASAGSSCPAARSSAWPSPARC